jgi:hypothetical protein
MPSGSAFAFQGMAYDLQPENATFTPAIEINYTIPQAQGGKEFIVTALVSHFCYFALFTKTIQPSPTILSEPARSPPQVVAPPPPTAMSTFSGIILWIIDMATKNVLVVAGIVILAVALFLFEGKRRRDRLRYLH